MAQNADRTRLFTALALNLVAPGAGLIVLRREWLGFALALLFVLLAQYALWGLFIIPAELPVAAARISALAAVVVWVAAQWIGVVRARTALGPEARHRLRLLGDQAAQAIHQRRFAEARDLLLIALAINDEDLAIRLQWAQLMTLMGRFREARKAWECVLKLDRAGAYHTEAVDALERLPLD